MRLVIVGLLIHVVASQKPEITKEIKVDPQVLRIGDTAKLECTLAYRSNNPVMWYFDDFSRLISLNDAMEFERIENGRVKYEVSLQRDTAEGGFLEIYSLLVNSLTERDNGNYSCRIRLTGTSGTIISKKKKITVLVPPKIDPSSTSSTVTVSIGADVVLRCAALGVPPPEIKWKRVNGQKLPDGSLLYSEKGRRVPGLPIKNVSRTDAGLYRCTATNTVVPKNPLDNIFDVKLDVQFGPLVIPGQQEYAQAQGRQLTAQLECFIEGNPAPEVRWYYLGIQKEENRELITDHEFDIQEHITHGSYMREWQMRYVLVIKNVRSGNYGFYRCQGKNKHGVNSATMYLYESFECQGVFCESRDLGANRVAGLIASLLTMLTAFLLTWLF